MTKHSFVMSVYSHICERIHIYEAVQTFLSKYFACLQGQTNTAHFCIKMFSNSLLMATESFVNISFFSVMYYPCCIKRELGCYTAKVIRGNKEGGITKVFFTVIQDLYCMVNNLIEP